MTRAATADRLPLPIRLALVALSLLLAGAVPPRAAQAFSATEEETYRAVFSAAALGVQRPSAGLATTYTLHYRGVVPHAAFAFAREAATGRSAWAFVGGQASPEAAEAAAVERCRRSLGPLQAECRPLIRDGTLLAGGLPPVIPQTGTIGPFRHSPLHLRRGPQAARGVVVWGHGYGGADRDNRAVPTPGIISILNDAGWDVLRFDRHPAEDSLFTSLPRLVNALPMLRVAGYRRIVLGGQSRGGWQAIMAGAERPDLVETVIAAAPAAHGEAPRPNTLGSAFGDFVRLIDGVPKDLGPRLLVALFDGDEFDPDPERRALALAVIAQARNAPVLALWPQAGNIRGHNGVADALFTRLYGGCVLTLVQAPEAAAPRGIRREPCGGG